MEPSRQDGVLHRFEESETPRLSEVWHHGVRHEGLQVKCCIQPLWKRNMQPSSKSRCDTATLRTPAPYKERLAYMVSKPAK